MKTLVLPSFTVHNIKNPESLETLLCANVKARNQYLMPVWIFGCSTYAALQTGTILSWTSMRGLRRLSEISEIDNSRLKGSICSLMVWGAVGGA